MGRLGDKENGRNGGKGSFENRKFGRLKKGAGYCSITKKAGRARLFIIVIRL
ncbi:hypothetical protein ES705_27393 [subsurface metagenome]|jgi:hypothetical protein